MNNAKRRHGFVAQATRLQEAFAVERRRGACATTMGIRVCDIQITRERILALIER